MEALAELKAECMAIGCGQSHTVAITTDGETLTWGQNKFGQLGVGGCRGAQRNNRSLARARAESRHACWPLS